MESRESTVGQQQLMNPRGERTQAEVARMLGVSKARVHQIEQRALIKLVRRLQADPKLRRWFEELKA